jgi:ElaB/YqjD/DUF883 family membrane-anchored ribosome-binding protein
MPSKTPNRKPATKKAASAAGKQSRGARHRADEDDTEPEMEHESDESHGMMAERASQVVDYAREHQGRVVLAALATGFSVGLLLGGLMGRPRSKTSWTDRLACEGVGRRLLDRIESLLPESITDRLG